MDYSGLPEHMQDGFRLYIEHRIPMGSFGTAVLENNLCESFARADHINRERLFDIVQWLYMNAPSPCWGSREKVNAWLEAGQDQRGKAA
jgi:hypothetical protein